MNPCRCLLRDISGDELLQNIKEYIDGLDEEIKTESEIYQKRLGICKRCDKLADGVCLKCGCYVEMRAAVKSNRCPSEKKCW